MYIAHLFRMLGRAFNVLLPLAAIGGVVTLILSMRSGIPGGHGFNLAAVFQQINAALSSPH